MEGSTKRILMVGGVAGGASCAARVRRLCETCEIVVFDRGPAFYLSNFIGIAASGVVLAYGIGSVAIAYEGIPRATALGAVYGAYGAGTAASPAVLTMFPRLIPSDDPSVPSTFT